MTQSANVSAEHDLDSAELYLNRELTWLAFNQRVLAEGEREDLPLLERVKFLAIVGNNLDEFFMKRIGGLKQQIGAGISVLTVDGRTPAQQVAESYEMVQALEGRLHQLNLELQARLADHAIHLVPLSELDQQARHRLRNIYEDRFLPLVTPQAIDPAHPFPFISNLSLNLLVSVIPEGETVRSLVRVKVPVGSAMPRFIRVPDTAEPHFVRIEDLIEANLDLLLPGVQIEDCERFRVTRNAITEKDEEEAADLLELIQEEVRERRFAPIVRLEVEPSMRAATRRLLSGVLGLDRNTDVFIQDGDLAYRDWFELAALDRPNLKHKPHLPVEPTSFERAKTVFDLIADRRSVMVHHPYESFRSTVERFVAEASEDPNVRAIKMTLYRTSEDSKIIDALINAARNEKQVAVVVELKARFDESKNIRWANRLEEAGIHVTYGVVGLKTHAKVIYVVRMEGEQLVRYAHIGTGNYHSGTARAYTDLGLFTCKEAIVEDLTRFFNYLTTGFAAERDYEALLTSPNHLKRTFLKHIEREVAHARAGRPASIRFKMNALEDADVTRALYQASQAGVVVDLIVRDSCRLRPGIVGLSETVTVISIVDRFLEHARLYHFHNGGQDEYYIGSADIMKRNLESRVETVVPITDPALKQRLDRLLRLQLADQCQAWEMQPDGSYVRRQPTAEGCKGSQEQLVERACRRRPHGNTSQALQQLPQTNLGR